MMAFSTTAERTSNRERLKEANSFVSSFMFGLSSLAFMDTAFSQAVTMRALMASQSKRGLGGLVRGG
jgi:uncharacterized phage infection (PIP) family protein YhgE